MPHTVTLFSDRPMFAPVWRRPLERHGFAVRLCDPTELATATESNMPCVIDAGCEVFDEDELLTTVGFLRAAGALPFVHADGTDVEDVVTEICQGCVTRTEDDVERVIANLQRRLDRDRAKRFEFVTVSPAGSEVLAILGDGHSVLLERPLNGNDDGTEVVGITLGDDAQTATLELDTGVTLMLTAGALAPTETLGGSQIPLDGARLGARLKELRLEAGLTQAELARRTGIHRPNIARVEAGRHTPSLETLSRLATAIGVPATRVLSED
jgi:DNA-binding XRE family transcriptional regulator